LRAPQNRAALNPAAFYKKSAQRLPEYFQVGTVIQGATEFYSSRLSKQQRGRTFAEELLHDADVKFTLKKRFTKLQVRRAAAAAQHVTCAHQLRRLKRKRMGKRVLRNSDSSPLLPRQRPPSNCARARGFCVTLAQDAQEEAAAQEADACVAQPPAPDRLPQAQAHSAAPRAAPRAFVNICDNFLPTTATSRPARGLSSSVEVQRQQLISWDM
jgi:hypothetical protein